jgi:hypothetical protein
MSFDIYVRTERGQSALNDPQARLDPWLKHVLRLIDGKRDLYSIGKSCPPGSIERLAATLAELGLVSKPGSESSANTMTVPMPIVQEMPPPPVALGSLPEGPTAVPSTGPASMSLRSLARSETKAPAVDLAQLQLAKLVLANMLLDHTGKRGDSLAIRMASGKSMVDLARLASEAEALIRSLCGAPAAEAFVAACREHAVPS